MRTERPKKAAVVLSTEQQEQLEARARRRKPAQALALRARIVLRRAQGRHDSEVAGSVGAPRQTVGRWRRRLNERGIDGLLDEPRPGAPRQISDATVEKVRDIVGPYLSSPDRAMVLCVDEKPQIQALDRSQPILPMRPGQIERSTHDYVRHGTTSLFAALDIKSGRVIAEHHRRHRGVEFRKLLDTIDRSVPQYLEAHLVLDDHGTHKTPLIQRWLLRHPRFHLHFTPRGARHGSTKSSAPSRN